MEKSGRLKWLIEMLIYTVFGLYVFMTCFCNTAWYNFGEGSSLNTFLKIVRYICYVLFLLSAVYKIRQKHYSIEAMIYFSSLLLFSCIGMFTGKDNSLFLTILFYMFLFGMSSNRLVKYAFIAQGLLLSLTIICAFAGLADNSLLDPVRMRYSLGFNWSNLGPILYLFVSSEYIYIRKNKITAIECVVMEIINVFLFKLTDTKMSFAILSVGLILVFVCTVSDSFKSYVKKILNKFYKGILLLPIIGAFLACWLPLYNSNSKVWMTLNYILSGRLWQCKNAIVEYGFSLFGRYIPVEVYSVLNGGNSDQTYFIDSGYLHFAMKYGIFIIILLVALYVLSLWKAYKKKDYYMIGIYIMLSVFCINDIHLISAFNIFTIYVFCDEDLFRHVSVLKKISNWINIHLLKKVA